MVKIYGGVADVPVVRSMPTFRSACGSGLLLIARLMGHSVHDLPLRMSVHGLCCGGFFVVRLDIGIPDAGIINKEFFVYV